MFGRRAQPPSYQSEFSGHFERTAIAVGEHAVANTYNGTVIQRFAAGTAPRPTRRPPPQRRPPRDPVELLGRGAETERIAAALGSASALAFHGSPGVGKTALLKHVAQDVGATWPDGVLYANVGAQSLEDVLQWLFTVFWDTGEVTYAPGRLHVGDYLQHVRALVVLDDVDLDAADVERLLGSASDCSFAIGAAQPPLRERSYPLRGLEAGAARQLFARALGRVPTAAEEQVVDAFVARVDGLPGYVVTGAELVRDDVCAPGELVEQPGAALARRRLVALPVEQQQLLGLLAELAPAAVPSDRLDPEAADQLERLRAAALVERHSPRYTLAGPVDAQLARDLPHMSAAELLRRWAAEPEGVRADDAPSISAAMAWGQRTGEHEEVLRAAKALAPAVVRTGRTGAWGSVVQVGLAAARRLDRVGDEALFLHERGTRLGCLGDLNQAYEALTRARDIRRQLHDEDGAAVTEHNLRELFGGAGGSGDNGDDGGGGDGRWRPPRMLLAGLTAVALVAVVAIVAFGRGDQDEGTSTVSEATATTTDDPDTTAPTITLTRPLDGDRVVANSRVVAAYRCRDRGHAASACTGTVPSGEAIDTTPGDHEFSVHARDRAGNDAEKNVTYHATKPGPASEDPDPQPGRREDVRLRDPHPCAVYLHERKHVYR